MRILLLVLTLALLPTAASAQGRPRDAAKPSEAPAKTAPDPKERVVFKKRTIIDFTGSLVEGDLIKPEGSYVVSRKASRFSTLIRVRENFLPELIASPNDL
ncbi:MAG: hypothetical protein ACAI38_12520 [Myxococcota bacterium]|nr:hypothetical protein [Myxococcota bacterium]